MLKRLFSTAYNGAHFSSPSKIASRVPMIRKPGSKPKGLKSEESQSGSKGDLKTQKETPFSGLGFSVVKDVGSEGQCENNDSPDNNPDKEYLRSSEMKMISKGLHIPFRVRVRSSHLPPPDPTDLYPQIFDQSQISSPAGSKILVVAVMGPANSGKSTLVNRIVGEKVSICAPLPQTTRQKVLGIWTAGKSQVIFVDTPGVISNQYEGRVESSVIQNYMTATKNVDHVLWVIDGCRQNRSDPLKDLDERVLGKMGLEHVDMTLVINKIDQPQFSVLSDKGEYKYNLGRQLDLMAGHAKVFSSLKDNICISAKTGRNMNALKRKLLSLAVPGPWQYPKLMKTNQGLLVRAEECIREQFYTYFRNEIPYTCRTMIVGMKMHEGNNELANEVGAGAGAKDGDCETNTEKNQQSDCRILEIHVAVLCPRGYYVRYISQKRHLDHMQYFAESNLKNIFQVPRVDLHFIKFSHDKKALADKTLMYQISH